MYVGIVLMCVDCVLASPRIAQADPGRQTFPQGRSITNHKLKQVMTRASRANKLLFQDSSSSSSRREAMLRCVRAEEEEEQHVKEDQGGEEEQGAKEEERGEEEEAALERVSRQTRRSHVVAPPIALTQEEDRVLIRPLGDK
jgi:hypothetical protein